MAGPGGNGAEGILIARVVTTLKLAVSWFLLASVFHAWDKEKLDQTGARWGTNSRAIWTGETATLAENRSPVTLFLLIETQPDYTYVKTQRVFHHLRGISMTRYSEAGFWKIERGRIRTFPKVCQGPEDVEYGGWGQDPCKGQASWSTELGEDGTWIVEESFGETKYTFPMKQIN